jgi:hypothetical protein
LQRHDLPPGGLLLALQIREDAMEVMVVCRSVGPARFSHFFYDLVLPHGL